VIFTDEREELLKAFERKDEPLSATEISQNIPLQSRTLDWMRKQQLALSEAGLAVDKQKPRVLDWMKKQQTSAQEPAVSAQQRDFMQPHIDRNGPAERGMDHAR
jgi:hypothetical protein